MSDHTSPLYAQAAATLRLDGVSKHYPDRRVLTDISFTVSAGERVGLIGENGSGKSTLLRVIAGATEPDSGTVAVTAPGGASARIGLLQQESPLDLTQTVADVLEDAVAPARAAEDALNRSAQALADTPDDARMASAYAHALEQAERLGAWDATARADAMLAGLGLTDLPSDRLLRELSGGQVARLSLAWLLLRAPDVLLLDEPTNHLDDAATAHLRSVLDTWQGPVLLASHDRAFLDEVVNSLIDLDPAPRPHHADDEDSGLGIIRFTGTYTDYLHDRGEVRQRWERQYRDEQAELKRLRAGVQSSQQVGHENWRPRTETRAAAKFYADRNARVVSRRVNDTRAKLDALERAQIQRPPVELHFAGPAVARYAGRLTAGASAAISASNIAVRGRLAPTSFTLGGGEKLLITGENGSGKSTLLQLIAHCGAQGEFRSDARPHAQPDVWSEARGGSRDSARPSARQDVSGYMEVASGLSVGLLTQQVLLPDPMRRGPERTVHQTYVDLVGLRRADEVPLGAFGLIRSRDEMRPVRMLSVGQQRRLALAALLADPPDILLLDEPTNHLSLLLVTQLEQAIVEYPGIVIVASHDRWLRQQWAGRRLSLVRRDVA